MGVTLLVCLLNKPATEALELAEPMLEDPGRAVSSAALDEQAAWPDDLCVALMRLVVGLCWRRTAKARMPLREALASLEELADTHSARPGIAAAAEGPRECVVCMAAPRECRYACGHCLCCRQCTRQLERCPSCRVSPIRIVDSGQGLAFEQSFMLEAATK